MIIGGNLVFDITSQMSIKYIAAAYNMLVYALLSPKELYGKYCYCVV